MHAWWGGRAAAITAGLTTLATLGAFLAPGSLGTLGGVATAGAQTVVPGSDCSAQLTGTALSRSGWVASTNAPSSSTDAPANAIDDNSATRFSSDETQRAGLYYEVDLGSQQSFNEIDMEAPNSPTDYAVSYDVEVSTDGTNWNTVAICAGPSAPEIVSFTPQTAQYVMVYLTGSGSSYWSIDEFHLLSSTAGANCSAAVSGTALSRTGWVASTNAPSSSTDAPANALDGNLPSRFSTDETQRPGLYFEVDLGSPQTFDELAMDTSNSPTDYARGYQVEVSDNGSSWATVASCTGTATPEVVSFPEQTAQYVVVYLTGTDSSFWWSIDEFNLYTSSTITTTTTTAPTTTTSVPTTTPAPKPPVFKRHRFHCVTWGWSRFHMMHRNVRVRVCLRIRPLPDRGNGQTTGYSQGSGPGSHGHGDGHPGHGRGDSRGSHRN